MQAGQRQDTARAGRTQPEQAGPALHSDLAGQGSAPAPQAPEPPAHPQPSERGPSPRSSSTAQTGDPGFVPLLTGVPLTPQVLGRSSGTQHYPTAHLHSTQPQHSSQPKHEAGEGFGSYKNGGTGRVVFQISTNFPNSSFSCPGPCSVPAPSHGDKNGTGDDTGDKSASGALSRATSSPPCDSVSSLPAAALAGCGLRVLQ